MRTALLTILLLSCPTPVPAAFAQGGIGFGALPPKSDRPHAASAGELRLAWEELDQALVDRFAMSPDGRAVLKHLITTRLVDRLGREQGIRVTEAEVDARWRELDRQFRERGSSAGLAGEIASQNLDEGYFREVLRIAIVQEKLTREALGLRPDARVSGEQQEIWIDQMMREWGYEAPPPPWKDGIAAHCGDLAIGREDYVRALRHQLPEDLVRDTCYQLLLVQALERRFEETRPELEDARIDAAIEAEIARRRADVAANPEYSGLSLEAVLAAQGIQYGRIRQDPAIRIAALSHLWIDEAHGDDSGPNGLRAVYERERETFDARFEAVRARMLFLRGAKFVNDLNPRSFEEAEEVLRKLTADVRTEEDFAALCRRESEHVQTKAKGGDLGWVSRADPRAPEELLHGLFEPVDTRPIPLEGSGEVRGPRTHLAGPMRLQSGVAMLWIAERREPPAWDEMRLRVRDELRRRLLVETLSEESVATFLDAP